MILDEYVIRLGTQVDNAGLKDIFVALDKTKLRSLGAMAGLVKLTQAVYNFIKGAAEAELELEKLAKKQKKTLEDTRASEAALKSMGKTLREVRKDAELQKTYEQLVKINKEMALPKMGDTIKSVKSLRAAFWELKDSANYVVNWIGARVLKQLEEPINRIADKFRKFAKWMRDNLNPLSMKLSSYITAFAKGVLGIAETFMKIVEYVNQMDPGIKKVGAAILAVFGILKTGPLGAILAVVTAIGGLIDDYENFKWNKANPDEEQVAVAFPKIWEALESGGLSSALDVVFGKVSEGLSGLKESFADFDIFKLLSGGQIDTEQANTFVFGIFDNLETAVRTLLTPENAAKLGEQVGGFVEAFLQIIMSVISEGIALLIGQMDGSGNWNEGLLPTIVNILNGIIKAIGIAAKTFPWSSIGADFGGIINGIFDSIANFFTQNGAAVVELPGNVLETCKTIAGGIVGAIVSMVGTLTEPVDPNDPNSKSHFGNMISSIVNMIKQAMDDLLSEENAAKLGTEFGDFANSFIELVGNIISEGLTAIVGSMDADGKWDEGLLGVALGLVQKLFTFIGTAAKTIPWGSLGDDVGTLINGLFTRIAEFFTQNSDTISTIPGDVLEAVNSMAGGIATFISTAIGNLLKPVDEEGHTGIDNLVDSLWGTLKGAITNLYERLTDPEAVGYIDLDQTAESIGSAIGNAIHITTDFLTKFCTEALEWIRENDSKLLEIGKKIANAILLGIPRGILKAIIGEEEYNTRVKDYQEFASGTQGVNTETGEKVSYREFQKMTPEEQAKVDFSTADRKKELYNKYGIPFGKDPISIGEEMLGGLSVFKGYSLFANGDENKLQRTLAQDLVKTMDSSDMTFIASTFAKVKAFSEAVEQGLHGNDFINYVYGAGSEAEKEEKTYQDMAKLFSEATQNEVKEINWATQNLHNFGGAVDTLRHQFENFKLPTSGEEGGEGDGPTEAWGGRIGREMNNVTVGEDGTEYIIPITKTERAFNLIKQMLSEMGGSFTNRLMSDLGLGTAGTIGSGMGSISNALSSGSGINMTYNVSAPVNINVSASGVSAEGVGEQAYNLASRYLVRTLQGVFA